MATLNSGEARARGATIEIIRTVLGDNRRAGGYYRRHLCKNCGELFSSSPGRWTNAQDWRSCAARVQDFYVMIGERGCVRRLSDRVEVFCRGEWKGLSSVQDMHAHLRECLEVLKKEYARYTQCYCSMECWATYSMSLMDDVEVYRQ